MPKIKRGSIYRNRSGLLLSSTKEIIQSMFLLVLDYVEIINMNAAVPSLKPLDAFDHRALCFIMGTGSVHLPAFSILK
jgi:hypothetical protein